MLLAISAAFRGFGAGGAGVSGVVWSPPQEASGARVNKQAAKAMTRRRRIA